MYEADCANESITRYVFINVMNIVVLIIDGLLYLNSDKIWNKIEVSPNFQPVH